MKRILRSVALVVALGILLFDTTACTSSALVEKKTSSRPDSSVTATPIQHVVVIFQENISFDHYFGTYPNATNPASEPAFHAVPGTPSVNGLTTALLTHNPNLANPHRLERSQALTCDHDHQYTDEQKAYDHGLVDKFVQYTTGSDCGTDKTNVMDYFDGNTVTALWNYAQHYALSDNFFNTTFGPSTPGAINLVSGQTHGAFATTSLGTSNIVDGTLISDGDPLYDDCSTTNGDTVAMTGKNIGDLLNARHISWGWFQGGFRPTATVNGKAVCGSSHENIGGAVVKDYTPHHEAFQYYKSTVNPHHLPPSSVAMIGQTDQANHQYDLQDFWAAVNVGNMPTVSFLKAPAYEDAHAGLSKSDPLDEQRFLVTTINQLQKSSAWGTTAVIIAYDDSDGWYDHVMGPTVNGSSSSADALSGPGVCGTATAGAYPARCGYGPRLPLLVISPYAKKNFVDHTLTEQTSIIHFIEDNWHLGRIGDQSFDERAKGLDTMFDFQSPPGRDKLYLDPSTGEPISN
jgi:phospholipase C